MIIQQDLSTYQSSFHEESAIVISLLVFEPISYHPLNTFLLVDIIQRQLGNSIEILTETIYFGRWL